MVLTDKALKSIMENKGLYTRHIVKFIGYKYKDYAEEIFSDALFELCRTKLVPSSETSAYLFGICKYCSFAWLEKEKLAYAEIFDPSCEESIIRHEYESPYAYLRDSLMKLVNQLSPAFRCHFESFRARGYISTGSKEYTYDHRLKVRLRQLALKRKIETVNPSSLKKMKTVA